MSILLLGRNGQVGWELHRLLARDPNFVALDRAQADLAQPEVLRALVRKHRPQVILNAAAYTAVDAAEKDEAAAHAINGQAPGVLAEEAARAGTLLVHYSTDYVFDGTATAPYREDAPTHPVSAYGRSKLAGEEAVRASGCRHLILRTSWVYASRGKNFLLTILRLANERDELRVVADQVGSPTWARSIAEATVKLAASAGAANVARTLHMTCGGQASWQEFASRIVEQGAALGLCRRVPVRPITTAEYPLPSRRPAYSMLSNELLNREFGVRLPDWPVALEQCLRALAAERRASPG